MEFGASVKKSFSAVGGHVVHTLTVFFSFPKIMIAILRYAGGKVLPWEVKEHCITTLTREKYKING